MKYYKSVEFCQFLECRAPPHKAKAPRKNAKPPIENFLAMVLTPWQRAETRERIASESLQNDRTKFYEVAGHVGRAKTVATNHLRKMVRCFEVVYTRQPNAIPQQG